MIPLAHSAGRNRQKQTYQEHICGVTEKAERYFAEITPYISKERAAEYRKILLAAAEYHDMGKLCADNQEVLNGAVTAKHLPVDHRDAGVKHLLGEDIERPEATLVYSHHRPGIPNIPEQKVSETPFRFRSAMSDSDEHLQEYLDLHRKIIGRREEERSAWRLSALEYRMHLSFLVDADYSDTGGEQYSAPKTCWDERLQKLDQYVNKLSPKDAWPDKKRNELRQELYQSCRSACADNKLEYCDSPVGTGKTTAVLAHMLRVAQKQKLRRIFIVLPYTNIITQTVNVLREAVVLDDEDKYEIVAENHHQADFDSMEHRQMSANWTAPIVVTTAVQFFETLASNQPAKLRKLHQLPGSGIIFDEYHAALPMKLMPVAWKWMTELTDQWGCYICMDSATTVEFWKEPIFQKKSGQPVVPLIPFDLLERLNTFERPRIRLSAWHEKIPHFYGAAALEEYIRQYQGSKIVVMNTVQSAATFANYLKNAGYDVLHLSSALTPEDSERTIYEVLRRLDPTQPSERNWVLVATSCVECGMNFSFHYGFCELRAVTSYIQLSGRVRRNSESSYSDARLEAFTVVDDKFSENPEFQDSATVFRTLSDGGILQDLSTTQAVTRAFCNENKLSSPLSETICKDERRMMFLTVADEFHVIDDDAVTVIASQHLAERLCSGETVSPRELQRGSVRIRRSMCKRLVLNDNELPILNQDQYDAFLGYMKNLV